MQPTYAEILDANRRFHDEVEADTYDARMGVRHDPDAVRELVAELERALGAPLPDGGVAVDLGAGTGHVAIKLALTHRFQRVVAVDISRRMLEKASLAAREHGCCVDAVVSDLQRLPFDDGSVDLVVGCAVLHHLPDPGAVLREVARVLRPGGACVFIGEPSTFGARMAESLKAPAVLAARAHRALTGRERRFVSEHVDVHTFRAAQLRAMAEPLAHVRVTAEGFLANAVDQGLLVLAERALPVPITGAAVARLRRGLRAFDRSVSDRVLPVSLRASLKLAARRAP